MWDRRRRRSTPLAGVERLGAGRPAVARQPDLLDAVLRRLQQAVAMRLQRLAAFIDADRLVERHLAALKIVDNGLQGLERLFEAHGRDVVVRRLGHPAYPSISRLTWAPT